MALTIPSPDQLRGDFKAATQSRRPTLTDWTTGSNLDALAWATALVGEEVLLEALRRFNNLFFSTNDRGALVTLIQDRFADQLVVQGETAAIGTLTLSRPDASAGDIIVLPGDTFFDADFPDITFTADSADVLVGTSLDVPITCVITGTIGNLGPGTIETVVRDLGDASITISNADRLAGGAPEETIEELKALVRTFYQSLRLATVPAIKVGAKSVAGVRVVRVDESHIAPEDGGYINVLVGDAEGNANSALTEAVDLALVNYIAGGAMWLVGEVSRQVYSIEVTIKTPSPLDFGPMVGPVREALLTYGYSLEVEATLYTSQLERVAINVSPLDKGGVIEDVDVRISVDGVWQNTDVTPGPGIVPRLESGGVIIRRWGA